MAVLVCVLLFGCQSEPAGDANADADSDADANADAGADADSDADAIYDGPAYTTGDFASFRWNFFGTGVGGDFYLDRDCGVDASQYGFPDGGRRTGGGVVASSDCEGFKALVVSPEVLGALETDASCGIDVVTDDFETHAVEVTSGVRYERRTAGCGGNEPFATVDGELHRLEERYVFIDGGTVGDADGGD